MRWFHFKLCSLKAIKVNTVKTSNVITSCMTFSCTSEKGPPFSLNPIRLAGTWNIYSNRAMDQLIRMMENKPSLLNQLQCENFRCPYQAIVINVLERTSSPMVNKAFMINFFIPCITQDNSSKINQIYHDDSNSAGLL